ncbi:hypothetical protein GCM10027199_77510 [Amycolatopsis magusensis]
MGSSSGAAGRSALDGPARRLDRHTARGETFPGMPHYFCLVSGNYACMSPPQPKMAKAQQ